MSENLRWRTNREGILECVNTETGEVVAVEKKKTKAKTDPYIKEGKGVCVLDNQGQKVWVPVGFNPDDLPNVIYPFSETTCDHILQKIIEGLSIEKIGKLQGFPPAHVIHKWRIKYPEFEAEVIKARKMKGSYFEDKAIDTAEEADEDNVQAKRLQVETYKWAAEVNDRNTYGKNVKVTGDANEPIAFIIDTGIKTAEAPAIATEAKPINEDEE